MTCERDRFLSFSSFLMDILTSPALLPFFPESPSEKVPLYGGINAACERTLRCCCSSEDNGGQNSMRVIPEYDPLMCLGGDIFEFLFYPPDRE